MNEPQFLNFMRVIWESGRFPQLAAFVRNIEQTSFKMLRQYFDLSSTQAL